MKHVKEAQNILIPKKHPPTYSSNFTIHLVRGLPGSGKSSLAKKMKTTSSILVSMDDAFKPNPLSNSDSSKMNDRIELSSESLLHAHKHCHSEILKSMQDKIPDIILDQPNLTLEEISFYAKMALDNCYTIDLVDCQTEWALDPQKLSKRTHFRYSEKFISSLKTHYVREIKIETLLKNIKVKEIDMEKLENKIINTYLSFGDETASQTKRKQKKQQKSSNEHQYLALFSADGSNGDAKTNECSDFIFSNGGSSDASQSSYDLSNPLGNVHLSLDVNFAASLLVESNLNSPELLSEIVGMEEVNIPVDQQLRNILVDRISRQIKYQVHLKKLQHDFEKMFTEPDHPTPSVAPDPPQVQFPSLINSTSGKPKVLSPQELFPKALNESTKILKSEMNEEEDNSMKSRSNNETVFKSIFELAQSDDLTLEEEYKAHRKEAEIQKNYTTYYREKSKEAIAKKQYGVAGFYSDQAHLHCEKSKDAHIRAAYLVTKERYIELMKLGTLDLHLLSSAEALEMLEIALNPTSMGFPPHNRSSFIIVTGRGLHSKGSKSVIRPKIVSYLRKHSISYSDENEGSIRIFF